MSYVASDKDVGTIEFEYWAENQTTYEDLMWYAAAGAAALGVFTCTCFGLIYCQSLNS